MLNLVWFSLLVLPRLVVGEPTGLQYWTKVKTKDGIVPGTLVIYPAGKALQRGHIEPNHGPLSCSLLHRGQIPAEGRKACWVGIFCEDQQDPILCLVTHPGTRSIGSCGKVNVKDFSQCTEDWSRGDSTMYKTDVILSGTQKPAQVRIDNRGVMFITHINEPEKFEDDLQLVSCAKLLQPRLKTRSGQAMENTNTPAGMPCKIPVTCMTANGKEGSVDCKAGLLKRSRNSKEADPVLRFCDKAPTRKLWLCDDHYQAMPPIEYLVDVFSDGMHSRGRLNIQPGVRDVVIFTDVSPAKSREVDQSGYKLECSDLPTNTVTDWPARATVKSCLAVFRCLTCGNYKGYLCRISVVTSRESRRLVVHNCRDEYIHGVDEYNCDLKSLGFLWELRPITT